MNLKLFISNLLDAVAAFASTATLISFFFLKDTTNPSPYIIWIIIIVGSILCILYALWRCKSKKKITIEINPSFNLDIVAGDLMEPRDRGVIVIPVNSYFNPIWVDRKNSVFKMFIDTLWERRMNKLVESIVEGLKKVEDVTGITSDSSLSHKYPLGTCIEIEDGGNTYVLVAAANKEEKSGSKLATNEYPAVIEGLFSHLTQMNVKDTVYMPLIGMGHGSMRKSARRTLYFLLDYIEFKYSTFSFPKGVCLKIKSLKRSNINLSEVEADFSESFK